MQKIARYFFLTSAGVFLPYIFYRSKKLTARYRWHFYTAAVGITLETKLNGLPCANIAVPAYTRCTVRIATAERCIP